MPKLQLERWQVFEIFSHIIYKIEKKEQPDLQLTDFNNTGFLNEKLNHYDNKALCSEVSLILFGEKKDGKGYIVPKNPSGFYELGRKVRLGEPVIIEEEMLDAMLAFINQDKTRTRSNVLKVEQRKYITPWLLSTKQSKFQDTSWWLFFYDRKYFEGQNKNKFVDGITKAQLKLHPFGKAEITSFSPDRETEESYLGQYEMYGKSEKHLLLQMQLKNTLEKDLHMLFYIGTDEISLSMGQYHNIGRSIYSGTAIITRNLKMKKIDVKQIGFYSSIDNTIESIPPHIRQYFQERRRNIIRTPCSITNESEFKRWLERKNGSNANG